jgi:Protein of unknown function (DUF2800)
MTISDPFLNLIRQGARSSPAFKERKKTGHSERKHSKFSASGAERWFNCPGSVELSEGLPDKDNQWSIEGTIAHEVLEALLRLRLGGNDGADLSELTPVLEGKPQEMLDHCDRTAAFIEGLHAETPGSDCQVETRLDLPFIDPEMFGTFDGAVIDYFGTLHVFDFKYGAGVPVSPVKNLQMVFYGLALAYRHHWNFKRVRLWIIQPRIKGYDGPTFWELSITELKAYIPKFKAAVKRVKENPTEYREGSWCHWCKAKAICPLKREAKAGKAAQIFGAVP